MFWNALLIHLPIITSSSLLNRFFSVKSWGSRRRCCGKFGRPFLRQCCCPWPGLIKFSGVCIRILNDFGSKNRIGFFFREINVVDQILNSCCTLIFLGPAVWFQPFDWIFMDRHRQNKALNYKKFGLFKWVYYSWIPKIHTHEAILYVFLFIFTHNDDDLQQTEYYYKGQLFFVKSSTRFILEQVSRNLNDDTRFFLWKLHQ